MDRLREKIREFKTKNQRKKCNFTISSGMAPQTDFGQSCEEQPLGAALSPECLKAYINMRVEAQVQARMASVWERLQKIFPKTLFDSFEVSTLADTIMTPPPALTPAHVSGPTQLNNLTVCPPIPSAGLPRLSQPTGKLRAAKPLLLLPKLDPLPPYHPRILPDMSLSSLGSIGSVSSLYTLASSVDQTELLDKVKQLDKDVLPKSRLPRLNRALSTGRASHQPCSRPPQAIITPAKFPRSRLPSPLRAQDIVERHRAECVAKTSKARLQNVELNRLPSLAKAKAILKQHKGYQTQKNLHPPPTVTQESRSHTQRHPTKKAFLKRFTSKVAPCPLPEKNLVDLSLGTPAQFFPFAKPQAVLDNSFKLISSDNWEKRIEGLNSIRRLAQCHAHILAPKLHNVCLVVVEEVKDLRSQVSRAAMATMGDLYLHLQRAMDPELDWTVKALLQKAGESNHFARQDVAVALGHMLRSCTPSRSMKALLNGGLSDRNVAIRECRARQLEALIDTVGAAHLLCCKKELLDSFLSTVSRLPKDASREVRSCGRNIIGALSANEELKKKMMRFRK